MTRLFLRFYMGVILILFTAWLIQAYALRRTSIERNISVVEDALAGGARLARDHLVDGGQAKFPETTDFLQQQFGYPVRIARRIDLGVTSEITARLDRGDVLLWNGRLDIALPESDFVVELGPLPQFSSPTQADITFGLGTVFIVTAFGIAVLLRPVAAQLRSVERTALAIADGDFSARIDRGRFRQSLPLAGAFNAMADRIETLLRSQKELLQAVSHELRTPLARIKFATELIQSAKDADERNGRLSAIDQATDQLDELVGELLTYVRLDGESEASDSEPFSLKQLVDDLIDLHAPLYAEIKFSSDSVPLAASVSAYRPAITRAISNLIVNAAQHARTKVLVSADFTDTQVRIMIDDDGPGIAEADRELVFEPFKRLPGAKLPGTGLGLALVRRIARRSGGEVAVSTSPLGGARFAFSLPIS